MEYQRDTLHISYEYSKAFGYMNIYNVWLAHDLVENNLMGSIPICSSLLKCNRKDPFLKGTIIYNEKMNYVNHVGKIKRQTASKESNVVYLVDFRRTLSIRSFF